MKYGKRLTRFAAGTLCACALLSGCTAAEPADTPAGTDTAETVSLNEENAKLRESLANLRLAQLLQAEAYEAEIGRLEKMTKEEKQTETAEVIPRETAELYQTREIEGGVEIVTYLGEEKQVSVPARLDGKTVLSVGEGAFRNCPVEEVILPQGIQKVDWFAFYGCYRLSSVTLPMTVTQIGYGAFELCGKNIVFHCVKGTYGAFYADSFGYRTELTDQ